MIPENESKSVHGLYSIRYICRMGNKCLKGQFYANEQHPSYPAGNLNQLKQQQNNQNILTLE